MDELPGKESRKTRGENPENLPAYAYAVNRDKSDSPTQRQR